MNYYSFDVFDTCLCRLCGEPRLLFDVLSLKVQKAMGETCNEHMRQRFVAARVNAGGKNLVEIYHHVAQEFPIPYSEKRMAELEMVTEREMLVPVLATRELVDQMRTKGEVLFISDMYLPSSFIKERLVEYGFFQEGDRLYVSDELQAWKHDGSLYRLVHEREGVPYRHWHHYGDNRHSDYKEPKKLGIHAHHIHYDYLPYEEQWRQIPALQYQYPAILAGVARAVRLSIDAFDDQKAFVSDVSAPLMVTWMLRVMTEAKKRGIRRLYFCARDMHSFLHVARAFRSVFPDIETQYLFISSPALYKDTHCFEYLCSQGLADDIPMAIVDTCTSGKTITVLNEILCCNGCRPVEAYFWGRMDAPNVGLITGQYEMDEGYLRAMTRKTVSGLFGMRIFYELVFSLNYHLKTVGYEYHKNKIRPVLCEDDIDQWDFENQTLRAAKRDNDTLLCTYAKAVLITGIAGFHNALFENIVIPTFVEFIDRPQRVYLNYLHRLKWWERVFVGDIHGKKKGVWKRGSLFYRMPSILASPLRFSLSNATIRLGLKHLVS